MPTIIKLRVDKIHAWGDSARLHVSMFCGPDEGHLQLSGELVLSDTEFMSLSVGLMLSTNVKSGTSFHHHCKFICEDELRNNHFGITPDPAREPGTE